jgi:uncharacterized membrane protein YtjA (UPF0391 family)
VTAANRMQPGCNPLNGSRMHRSEWKSRAGLHARRRPDRRGVKTMLICSLAFLVVALLMALLDLGGDAGIATWSAEVCFAISVTLFLSSLISHYRRSHGRITGTNSDH